MHRMVIVVWAWLCLAGTVQAGEVLRIFTWQGYVTADDLAQVNRLLQERKLDVRAEIIQPFAEGPEQMFEVMRWHQADLSFFTLNYIQMQEGRGARLLQGIDTRRIPNFARVRPELAGLPMGKAGSKLLYVPFGGGAYGIWANMDKLKPEALPRRLNELLDERWRGKISLTSGQVQPNVALAYMAVGEPPFLLDSLVQSNSRQQAKQQLLSSPAKRFLDALYQQVSTFWTVAPQFSEQDLLVASYGPEIARQRSLGRHWILVPFEEGNTVWLDTMNIAREVSGAKLDAAYIFIDYMLSDAVQRGVVERLSMVAVTKTVKNPLLDGNPDFFRSDRFWPPYAKLSDNLMKAMSDQAMRSRRREGSPVARHIPVPTPSPSHFVHPDRGQ